MSGRYAEVVVRGLVCSDEEAQEWIRQVVAGLHESGASIADQREHNPYAADDWWGST